MTDNRHILVSGERSLDKTELAEQGSRAAAGLLNAGIMAGDAVALILRNDFPYFVMHEAARFGPFSMVPVNWHLNAREIAYILEDCHARAVIIHEDLLVDELASALQGLFLVIVPTPGEISLAYDLKKHAEADPIKGETWPEWIEKNSPCNGDALPFCPPLFYTSGSSGRPKAVIREEISADIAVKIGARTAFAWGFDKDVQCSVMTGPLYHSAPNGYANMVLQAGATLVLQARFDAEELLQLIEQYRVTHLHMVPTMFSRLLSLPDDTRRKYSLSSLSHVSHGAAPCPSEVKQQMIEWWGPVIHEYYAMTETGIICCSSSEQWLAHPGSVGCAAPGVSLQIRDDNGNTCEPGEVGLICVQHEATSLVSYHGNNTGLIEDDYLVTGDIGHLDNDGFLYISDRKSDMVISGGVNIYPAEVEKELINLEGVRDCCVLGIPDKEFGEKLIAFIETDEALQVEDIINFLRQRIATFKVPRIFELVTSLPREDSGKIKKREIRDSYLARTT